MEHLRSTRAEINLDNLKHNIGVLRRELGPDVEPMAIIKADCYGHGAVIMMEYMMKYGLRYFGVASLNEAMELRRFHKDGEILVLGPRTICSITVWRTTSPRPAALCARPRC